MSDMVERVARAIWNSNFHLDDVASGEAERRIADWPSDWEKAERQACAAIVAMQADAEPVAWLYTKGKFAARITTLRQTDASDDGWTETPLYAHPIDLAAERETVAKIVAWLREMARDETHYAVDVAYAIEAGEWNR